MSKLENKIKKYKAKFVALSPIHIGTGEAVPACRYVLPSEGDKCGWCLKESFSARLLAEGRVSIREYMEKPLRADNPIFKGNFDSKNILYPVSFSKAARERLNKEVKPFVRNAFGKAYLPGSSLKGMIRTSLVFSMIMNEPQVKKDILERLRDIIKKMRNVNKANIKDIRKKDNARVSFIESFFRPDTRSFQKPGPQNDILRAIKVSDSEPTDVPLVVAAVNIFTSKDGYLVPLSGDNPPVFCEVVEPGTSFTFDITIDEWLLERLEKLNPKIKIKNHYDLLMAMQDHAKVMTRFEKAFLDSNDALEVWDNLYEEENEDSAVVRLGWGSGWIGASLFPILAYDPDKETPNRPLSRKIVITSKGERGAMLGWGKLYIEEIS